MTAIITYFRVSYSDTDQMGFMHHSNYLRYYETARWELFRSLGLSYAGIEDEGIILPVTSASLKFIKPALYDQLIQVSVALGSLRGPLMVFNYQALNEKQEIINEAKITVAFVKKSTGKACHPTEKVLDVIKNLSADLK